MALINWTNASYYLSSTSIEGQEESGSFKIHKTLAWFPLPLKNLIRSIFLPNGLKK